MSSYILISGEERITIKLIMDNNCNKLHVVSLSKVNKRMFNKKISTKQPSCGLSSSPSSLELWVLHARFTYAMKQTHVTKGQKEIQKNYEKLLLLILLHFTVSNKLPGCSCFHAVYLIQWWKFILFFLGRRVRRTSIFLTRWLIWSLLPPSSSGEAPFLFIQLWF